MGKRLLQVAAAIVVVLAGSQLVRPDRTNPETDARRTIQAHAGVTSEFVAILDRSCGDCHSSATKWPWYATIAPLSWLMAYGVNEGRRAVNFSEWAGYSPEEQGKLLAASCSDAVSGKMPGLYTVVRPETRLSSQDVETICVAARKAEADARHER